MTIKHRFARSIAFVVSLTALGVAGAAQPHSAAAAVSPDVAAAAKREGVVVWYAAVDAQTLAAVVARFEQLHAGIKLEALQIGSTLIPARVMTEHASGNAHADLVSGDDFSLSQLANAGILQPYRYAEAAKFAKGSVDPNGYWTTLYDDTTVIAWNPAKLKADGLKPPATLADLGRPEWRGKIAIDSSAYNWYDGTLKTQPDAQNVLRRIAENKPFITSGHTQTVTQLAAGEFDVTPTAYGYMVDRERQRGRSVDFVKPKPMIVGLVPIAMMQGAPHANAARVALHWLLSREGQQFFVDTSGRTSARADVNNNPRVFKAGDPFYILPAPERPAVYNGIIADFRKLLGIGG